MDWNKIQNLIKEPIPECIKQILSWCAYDTIASVRNINSESLFQIQRQVNSYFLPKIQELTCCYAEFYKQQSKFELLPGHRDFILTLPKYLNVPTSYTQNIAFSTILNSLIETSEQNAGKDKHQSHYDDIIRYFSTYLFLRCGRSCYELLNHNLPLPSTRTVCECWIHFIYFVYFYSQYTFLI